MTMEEPSTRILSNPSNLHTSPRRNLNRIPLHRITSISSKSSRVIRLRNILYPSDDREFMSMKMAANVLVNHDERRKISEYSQRMFPSIKINNFHLNHFTTFNDISARPICRIKRRPIPEGEFREDGRDDRSIIRYIIKHCSVRSIRKRIEGYFQMNLTSRLEESFFLFVSFPSAT